MFIDDKGNSTPNEDEEIIDDLDTEDDAFTDLDDDDDSSEEDESKEERNDRLEKAEKKVKTLTKKYEKAVKRIETLSNKQEKGKPLTDEEKKELNAEEWFKKQYEKVNKENLAKKAAEKEAISEEIDEILDDNPTLKESQLLEVIEEYAEMGVRLSPKQALKILNKQPSKTGKEKPKLPRAKRGEGKVESTTVDRDSDAYKKMSPSERWAATRNRIQKKWGDKLK